MSVELYRVMHNGNLPPKYDMSVIFVTKFLDEVSETPKKHFGRENFGSLYLTSKRMVYKFSEQILNEYER